MNKKILFVFEGQVTEPSVLSSLKRIFFEEDNNTIVEAIFDAELFQFMNQIKEDSFLDLVVLLKNRGKWNDVLEKYSSSEDFTSIYLFFDHDAHSHSDTISIEDYHNKINDVLSDFDNETENGKLYISYPMVEAIKDTLVDAKECTSDCCTYVSLNTQYKYNASVNALKDDFRKWTKEDWCNAVAENLIRCYMLETGNFQELANAEYTDFKYCSEQILILQNQLKFYKKKAGRIVVISGFAIFLHDFYGKSFFDSLDIKQRLSKYCTYTCLNFNS